MCVRAVISVIGTDRAFTATWSAIEASESLDSNGVTKDGCSSRSKSLDLVDVAEDLDSMVDVVAGRW
jgi:hypothetical protein